MRCESGVTAGVDFWELLKGENFLLFAGCLRLLRLKSLIRLFGYAFSI